ncbi:MFS transporter [Aquabacterium humicola]|uniref:MFS transporter n=1 Tax=Aquabacterium humicola TaxID=3237377 RepID=UPI0025426C65|nr:MFS transporter [Rubrivivax pictus]
MTRATPSPQASSRTPPPRGALLRDRNVAWLVGGGLLSMLGDQFTLVALPWLVLQLSRDPLVLGTVIAMMGVPRAAFLLIGGALVDRHSPKRVMMVTKHVNTVLLAALAVLVWTGTLTLPLLYVLALGIGLATAFSIPAGTAMLPQVVERTQLAAANGLMLGLRQLTMFLGPVLAALLIWLSAEPAAATGPGRIADARGLTLAFAFDALTFAVSAWTLPKVRMRHATPAVPQAVLAAVAEGLRTVWRDVPLRSCLLYWAAVALLITGPIHIALPLLADAVPAIGGAGFGVLLAAHGAGTLVGMAIAGARPHWRLGSLGLTMLAVDALVALLFMPMGRIGATWQGGALLLAIGVLGGFMQVAIFTWIQQRVAPAMLGRAMSLFMFIFVGLAPLSSALTGWLMRGLRLDMLFLGCGVALLAVVVIALAGTRLRHVSELAPAA